MYSHKQIHIAKVAKELMARRKVGEMEIKTGREEKEQGEVGFGLFNPELWTRIPPSSSRYNSSQEIW